MTAFPALTPNDMVSRLTDAAAPARPAVNANQAKARATAQDFEAMFLNTMFQHMFTGMDGDGPFGGSGAVGVWRSFLTQEYSKTIAKAGGVGIADQVYRSLMAHQEIKA
jgi:Rod binding domain-containing protein